MKKSVFINPFVDRGFKILFGQESSKELLIELINDLLEGEHHVEDLSYMDKEIKVKLLTAGVSSSTCCVRIKTERFSLSNFKCTAGLFL